MAVTCLGFQAGGTDSPFTVESPSRSHLSMVSPAGCFSSFLFHMKNRAPGVRATRHGPRSSGPGIPLEVAGSVRRSSCRVRTPRPEAKQRHDRSPAVGTK